MKGKRCRITDIARLAGISPATVSRALNDHPYVTKEVHDRIYAAMHHLGYDPRPAMGRKRVAVLLNDRNNMALNSYGSSMLFQLMCACERHQLAVEMIGTSNLSLVSDHFLRVAISFQEFPQEFQMDSCPYTRFICINGGDKGAYHVHSDDYQGISLGFDALWQSGCRRLGLILPSIRRGRSAEERLRAFCQMYGERGNASSESHVAYLDGTPVENIARLFKKVNPDGLLLGGEDMVLMVNYALSLLDKRIPEDVSLVSYENIFASALMIPPHTTVAQDVEALAERAVLLALQCLDGEEPLEHDIVIPNKLIERESISQRALR